MRCLGLVHFIWVFSDSSGASTACRLKIVALEGDGAINNIQLGRAKEPVVELLDAHNAPVKNATVCRGAFHSFPISAGSQALPRHGRRRI